MNKENPENIFFLLGMKQGNNISTVSDQLSSFTNSTNLEEA